MSKQQEKLDKEQLQQDQFVGDFEDCCKGEVAAGAKRGFEGGATRDTDDGKFKYEGFENPMVIRRFAEYMHKNRHMKDGTLRDPDNWQNLFGDDHFDVCIDSLVRHVMDLRLHHRGYSDLAVEGLEDSICGILFNAKAYLLKVLIQDRETEDAE
jgi:hypothetical protein